MRSKIIQKTRRTRNTRRTMRTRRTQRIRKTRRTRKAQRTRRSRRTQRSRSTRRTRRAQRTRRTQRTQRGGVLFTELSKPDKTKISAFLGQHRGKLFIQALNLIEIDTSSEPLSNLLKNPEITKNILKQYDEKLFNYYIEGIPTLHRTTYERLIKQNGLTYNKNIYKNTLKKLAQRMIGRDEKIEPTGNMFITYYRSEVDASSAGGAASSAGGEGTRKASKSKASTTTMSMDSGGASGDERSNFLREYHDSIEGLGEEKKKKFTDKLMEYSSLDEFLNLELTTFEVVLDQKKESSKVDVINSPGRAKVVMEQLNKTSEGKAKLTEIFDDKIFINPNQ